MAFKVEFINFGRFGNYLRDGPFRMINFAFFWLCIHLSIKKNIFSFSTFHITWKKVHWIKDSPLLHVIFYERTNNLWVLAISLSWVEAIQLLDKQTKQTLTITLNASVVHRPRTNVRFYLRLNNTSSCRVYLSLRWYEHTDLSSWSCVTHRLLH